MSNLDGFEKIVKDKLQQQQYDYDSSQWNAIEKRLPPPKKGFPWKYIAAASTFTIASILLWQLQNTENQPVKTSDISISALTDSLKITSKESYISNSTKQIDEGIESAIIVDDHALIEMNQTAGQIDEPKNVDNTLEQVVISQVPVEPLLKDETQEYSNLSEIDKVDPQSSKIARPSAQFTITTKEACVGEKLTFNSLNKLEDTRYNWDFGNGETSENRFPVYSYKVPGIYYVQLKATSTKHEEIINVSDKIAIQINPTPSVDFSWVENTYNAVPTVEFTNLSEHADSWSWNFQNGIISDEKNPIITFKKKGFYQITLTASNVHGCVKISQQELEVVTDYNLLAPNSFTPNADGINDDFIPEALKILNVGFEMTIFDKRGLIYQSRSLSNPWTGENQRDGGFCTQGAYVWIVKYKNQQGIDQIYKGTINLLH